MSDFTIKVPKKLIEVALPLDIINTASSKEKTKRQGTPANLHRWWARRPLASARAVVFAQMVNDPGYQVGRGFRYGLNKKDAAKERERLFKIIEELVLWENHDNVRVLDQAFAEIKRSWVEVCELNKHHPKAKELFDPERIPGVHDPFAGGGTIPLEAQRLRLSAVASDLNPVAVLLNKAMVEIPAKFKSSKPIHLGANKRLDDEFAGAEGLFSDVRHYADWLISEASEQLSQYYPRVEIANELGNQRKRLAKYSGQKLTVLAWLWARTVKSPDRAFDHVDVPLVTSFLLSAKKDKQAYLSIETSQENYRFHVHDGKPDDLAMTKAGTKIGRGAGFRCVMSGSPIPVSYIREQASLGLLGERLMSVVALGEKERVYLPPDANSVSAAKLAKPTWSPEIPFFKKALGFRVGNYGISKWSQLFTDRQLLTLSTLMDLVQEAHKKIVSEGKQLGFEDDGISLENGGSALTAYADSIVTYLTLIVSKFADSNNSFCPWEPVAQCSRQLFGMQTLPMRFDFAEANPLSGSSGSLETNANVSLLATNIFPKHPCVVPGVVYQQDASHINNEKRVISTDPPYYDNIGYADLSDFFYVWLRKGLREFMPLLFSTREVPKKEELVATQIRNGTKHEAEDFFLQGMKDVIRSFSHNGHPAFPVTFYYAFKQSELTSDGIVSSGWETFLTAILDAGFQIVGTWPMRTESTKALKAKRNALASSVVLVCVEKDDDAEIVSRRDFIRDLNRVLPEALDEMTRGIDGEQSPIAPVDLSQAVIGPGMAVFSKFQAVLEADGSSMTVKTALKLINRFLAEDDFDPDTQFCLHWFEQHGWRAGAFGEADVLARAKATSVDGLSNAGVLSSGEGKVQLLRWSDYDLNWNPKNDSRIPIWEALHQLVRVHKQGGDKAAGKLLGYQNVLIKAEAARQLAYRLYTLCERKGWAEDARNYNELITAWSNIESAAPETKQGELF